MKVKKPLLGTAFSKVAFLPSPAPCSPRRPRAYPLLWSKYFWETKTTSYAEGIIHKWTHSCRDMPVKVLPTFEVLTC